MDRKMSEKSRFVRCEGKYLEPFATIRDALINFFHRSKKISYVLQDISQLLAKVNVSLTLQLRVPKKLNRKLTDCERLVMATKI